MRRLAVFARAPVPGRVKSRLSPALPARLAALLYAGLLGDTFTAGEGCPADERWAYWADEPGPAPESFRGRAQHGEGLGERLGCAFDELLLTSMDHALVLGSDTPALTRSHLGAAFDALESHDVVLGPTPDGGYWCIGLNRSAPRLFQDIPWSTDQVLACTTERARELDLSVAHLAKLHDLDTPHDLARLLGQLAGGADGCGANAHAALRAMGLLPASHG
jgi:rSAM/selenodomain-associated transferase 1